MSAEIKRLVVKQLVNCLKLRETQFTSSCSNTLKILIPRVQSMLTNTLPTNKWPLKSGGKFSITTLAETILMQSHKGFLRPALLLLRKITIVGDLSRQDVVTLLTCIMCQWSLKSHSLCQNSTVGDSSQWPRHFEAKDKKNTPWDEAYWELNCLIWKKINRDWLLVYHTPGQNIPHICCFLSYLPFVI